MTFRINGENVSGRNLVHAVKNYTTEWNPLVVKIKIVDRRPHPRHAGLDVIHFLALEQDVGWARGRVTMEV